MRDVVLFTMTTLDGYYEGPDHDLEWHNVDEEFNEFAVAQLDAMGGLIFGRVTYELMASYWPTDAAKADDPQVASRMNAMPKFVFSETLEGVDWANTTLLRDAEEGVARLTQEPGKDLIVMGSGTLAASLAARGLIDEYRIMINPVVLGNGTPLFGGIAQPPRLTLRETRTFASGNVLLTYGRS